MKKDKRVKSLIEIACDLHAKIYDGFGEGECWPYEKHWSEISSMDSNKQDDEAKIILQSMIENYDSHRNIHNIVYELHVKMFDCPPIEWGLQARPPLLGKVEVILQSIADGVPYDETPDDPYVIG